MGNLGISRDNPDYYAVSVMNYILGGGGFSSRLMDSVRDRMGLAYGIYSAFVPASMDGAGKNYLKTIRSRSLTGCRGSS